MGDEETAYQVFTNLIKQEKGQKTLSSSSTSGGGKSKAAAAKGKGGRAALLKKVQQAQAGNPSSPLENEPTKAVEPVEQPPSENPDASTASSGPVLEDSVINILQFALRGLGRYKELRQIYQDSWNAHEQKDPEMGAQAFLCSARLGDYADMQKSALLLFQKTQDPKMAHWGAMSLYLQATDPATKLDERPLLLSLAYSLLSAAPANPYRTADVFTLWLRICRAAGQTFYSQSVPTTGKGIQNGYKLELEALEALTPDLRRAEKDSELEKGWWAAFGADLRIKWERWEMIQEIANRIVQGESKKTIESIDANVEGDVPDADEQDVTNGTAVDDASKNVDWLTSWDWEKEWERGDDEIRGAGDLP